MVIQEIDGVKFRLKKPCDLRWIKRYGTVFTAIDETGSGCLCFGMRKENERFFAKVAGAGTTEAEVSPEESVRILKNAAELYRILRHPALTELLETHSEGNCYAAVFRWMEGTGLFEHWNFARYAKEGKQDPMDRFKKLPIPKKLAAAETIFSFMENVADKKYVAVDFYDGSLIYDFQTDRLAICDIDLFRKQPAVNEMGSGYWGTKRLKAPEEYVLGAEINEATNVFTIGALLFDFFGEYTTQEIKKRYEESRFRPCSPEKWTLGPENYRVMQKAVCPDRKGRYQTIREFKKSFLGTGHF